MNHNQQERIEFADSRKTEVELGMLSTCESNVNICKREWRKDQKVSIFSIDVDTNQNSLPDRVKCQLS